MVADVSADLDRLLQEQQGRVVLVLRPTPAQRGAYARTGWRTGRPSGACRRRPPVGCGLRRGCPAGWATVARPLRASSRSIGCRERGARASQRMNQGDAAMGSPPSHNARCDGQASVCLQMLSRRPGRVLRPPAPTSLVPIGSPCSPASTPSMSSSTACDRWLISASWDWSSLISRRPSWYRSDVCQYQPSAPTMLAAASSSARGHQVPRSRLARLAMSVSNRGIHATAASLRRRPRRPWRGRGKLGMAIAGSTSVAGLLELLSCEHTDRLQHPEATRRSRPRLGARLSRPAMRGRRGYRCRCRRRLARRRRASTRRRRPRAAGTVSFARREQVVAPADRRAERLLACRGVAQPARQHPEAVVQPREQVIRPEQLDARRGQL